MAKKKTTKFQTYPTPYQFGGLNTFLQPYTNLTSSWDSFWKKGNYFSQGNVPPTGVYADPSAMLYNTVQQNNSAINNRQSVTDFANKTGADVFGKKAIDYTYQNDWNKRNPNATAAEKLRYETYNNYLTNDDKGQFDFKGDLNTWYQDINAANTQLQATPGASVSDYTTWKDAREKITDKAKAEWNSNNRQYNTMNTASNKEMSAAMTNTAGGLFSGLNYMNAYTPPETINLDQGSKGVMYQKGGNVKGPGLRMSPMMDNFGATQAQNSQWAHFPSGNDAISALDSLLFSGNSKYYKSNTKVADALAKYSGGDYSKHKYAKKTLGNLKGDERVELLNDIVKKEVTSDNYNTNYAGAIAGRQIGPSMMDYQVTSRQDGGNVNLTGYTPGTPTMQNNMNEIPSGDITMEKTPIPLLAIGKGGADNGLLKVLQPNSKGYNFKSKSTVEIPLEQQQQDPTMAKYGKLINSLKKYNNGGDPTNPISIFQSLKAKGYLQEYDENTFNKLSAEEQNMLFKAAAADFNSKQTGPQGQIIQEIRRPLATQLNTSMMVPNQMSFEDAFAQARAQGLQQFEFNGALYNTKIDPNAKPSSGKANSMQIVNTSQTGLARDLIGNKQFGGIAGMIQKADASGMFGNYSPEQAAYLQQLSGGEYINATPQFNASMLQGFNQVQAQPKGVSIPMLPTINPSIVEPMSGLGFNINKMAAEMSVNSGVRLKKGGTQKVAAYQQMLKANGYDIEIDGAWGPKTQAAYEAYTGKKAPSKTAVQTGKAKVASNIAKRDNGEGYLNNPAMRGITNNSLLNAQVTDNNSINNTSTPEITKHGPKKRIGTYNESVSKNLQDLLKSDKYRKANKFLRAGMLVETDPISALQMGLGIGNMGSGILSALNSNSLLSAIGTNIATTGFSMMEPISGIFNAKEAINNPNTNVFIPNYYNNGENGTLSSSWLDILNKQYGGYVPKFQFGGSVNDQHATPIFSSNLEDFGLTELQTEKDEVAFMPDGSVVDVKAKKLHKHQDKDNVSDIMQSGTYIFSNDPKMKFGVKSKLGGVELGDMKLGKSVFKYKENEVTPGPEDIMLKDMFFNGSKKELTTAEIAKNIKKNLPIVDMKNDYFADRAIAENKDQRLEYLSVLKAFNEYKKPKQRSIPKAQYGMPIQPTQNGLDGVMGYGDKQMDPYKRMDNNMISMWNMPQPKLPSIPKMYEDGGMVPQAQFGWLADGIDAIGGWSRRAERKQRGINEGLRREAQGYRDELQQGVDTAGSIGVGTNLATYAASLNVPLQRYDDQSEQMAMYNAAANRATQRLEASKYTASQGIGGASSLARYSNPTNYGDYLSKVQSQSDGNIGRLNQAIADLDMQRANANVGFTSTRNAGRNQSLNARDTQLYNANVQGLGNVGRSAQEATFNSADTRYRMGNEKMAYDAYLEDKAIAARQAKQQQIRGYANEIGGIGVSVLTGGIPIPGLTPGLNKSTSTMSNAGQPSFTGFNPATFSGPNFQNPTQMSPANQQFNPNYGGFTTYNTINPGGLVDRGGGRLSYDPITGTWR